MSVAVFTDKTTVDPRDPFPARELDGSPFTGRGLKGSVGIAIDGANLIAATSGSPTRRRQRDGLHRGGPCSILNRKAHAR